MSDLDLTEAREMAAALYKGLTTHVFAGIAADDYEGAAKILTANLVPVIERQVRERIARELAPHGYTHAIRIVRGES